MTVSEILAAGWKALRNDVQPVPGIYERRVFAQSGYSLSVGITQPTGLSLLMLVASRASVRGRVELETRGFKLHVEPHGDPRCVRIRLEETHRSFGDLFEQLCQDVVTAILASSTEGRAVEALCTRVAHWHRFMEKASKGLSQNDQLGLYGELYFLKSLIAAGCNPERAIDAWQGPLAANHDFMFGKIALEIKSTTANSGSKIYISNERQLDDTGVRALFLGHLSFDRREHTDATLPKLVDEIVAAIDSSLIPLFEDRLLAAGYHRSQARLYVDVGYTERKLTYYRVSEEFPRIVPRDLKTGVQEVHYSVELAGATSWLMIDTDILGGIV